MNRSLADPAEPHEGHSGRSSRLRFELMYAAVLLAFGLFVLPALIYSVGVALLGPYGADSGGEAGWGRFYGDFFADLAAPSIRAWAIAGGPLLLVTIIRSVFLGMGRRKTADPAPRDASAGRRQAPSPAAPRAAQAQPRQTPRLDPPLDTGPQAADPSPPQADTVIAAEPRRPSAGPQRRPGRIEPRISSD